MFRILVIILLLPGCVNDTLNAGRLRESVISCMAPAPEIQSHSTSSGSVTKDSLYKEDMVLIPGGSFMMGASDNEGRPNEYPQHKVRLNSFWMDEHEVTNEQFAEFVKATGYKTTAEKKPDWNELKKQLPPGTEKPPDSLLNCSSLVFVPATQNVSLDDVSQWWSWKQKADWKHPLGPDSDIKGKENYPVVHISWFDAMAYCKWAGKRLPTEAEWEWAARGKLDEKKYPWGDESLDEGKIKANTWQGNFPVDNLLTDKYYRTAPVKSFQPNAFKLYDMAGNVWEWCSDWYHDDYYEQSQNKISVNPKGPAKSFDSSEPLIAKRIMRGGSFLCNPSYCKGYRVSARMKTSPDTGLEHTGFRCVRTNN